MKLTGVSETLLIPLYVRYIETKRKDHIINDPKSIEILNNIDYDFNKIKNTKNWKFINLGIVLRVKIIDLLTKVFLQDNPDTVVINLGAGLCTRYFRINNKNILWYELDLPEVNNLWEKLIGESEKHKFLTYSVFDYKWIDDLRVLQDKKVLFIAEGLFTYFEESEVKKLILKLKDNFTEAHIIMDALPATNLKKSSDSLGGFNAEFKWGIDSFKELEEWSTQIKIVSEWSHIDLYPERWGFLKYLRFIPDIRKHFQKTAHLKFVK